jgi:hypothetical protein
MNKQLLKEVVNKIYPINNTGSMFMANREEVNNSYRQEGFLRGFKFAKKALYSEEEVVSILYSFHKEDNSRVVFSLSGITKWFKNFKKK